MQGTMKLCMQEEEEEDRGLQEGNEGVQKGNNESNHQLVGCKHNMKWTGSIDGSNVEARNFDVPQFLCDVQGPQGGIEVKGVADDMGSDKKSDHPLVGKHGSRHYGKRTEPINLWNDATGGVNGRFPDASQGTLCSDKQKVALTRDPSVVADAFIRDYAAVHIVPTDPSSSGSNRGKSAAKTNDDYDDRYGIGAIRLHDDVSDDADVDEDEEEGEENDAEEEEEANAGEEENAEEEENAGEDEEDADAQDDDVEEQEEAEQGDEPNVNFFQPVVVNPVRQRSAGSSYTDKKKLNKQRKKERDERMGKRFDLFVRD